MEEPLRYHRTFGLDAEQLDELEARIEDILPDPWDKGTGRPAHGSLIIGDDSGALSSSRTRLPDVTTT